MQRGIDFCRFACKCTGGFSCVAAIIYGEVLIRKRLGGGLRKWCVIAQDTVNFCFR